MCFTRINNFIVDRDRPTERAIKAIVTKIQTNLMLLGLKPPTRMRIVRTEPNIAAVAAIVNEDRNLYIRRRSQ